MPDRAVAFGPYRLDSRGGLTAGTRSVRLTPKALALLCALVDRAGQVITKDELFAAVWADTTVGDAALVTCIQEIRKALRDDARQPRYVETLHRRGYRFIGKLAPPEHGPGPGAPIAADAEASILVGRDDELAQLHDALARARTGQRHIVFVTGEPGIGKTSLVRAFVAQATGHGEALVAWGQAAEHYGAAEPYLPLLDALARVGRGPSGAQIVRALDQHAPTWLAQMPTLITPAQLHDLRRRTAGVTRDRMLRELTDALEAASQLAPIVLWLDDLHWADVSTVDWLGTFARRPESARFMLVATYRPTEVLARAHPLHGLSAELRRHRHCREIALPTLNRAAVGSYLSARLAPGAARAPEGTEPLSRLGEEVHRRTEGNPLFMVAVVDDLVDRGVLTRVEGRWVLPPTLAELDLGIPADVQRLIARQLERLDAGDVGLLEVASAVGAEFSAAVVAAAMSLRTDEAETACLALVRRQQIIHAAGAEEWPDGTVASRYGFQHALYREALYARVPAGRRVDLHRRVGRHLRQGYGERADEIAGELAMHFERGRDVEQAVRYLSTAGRVASHRGAAREAEAYFGRALALIGALPPSRARAEQEADVRLALCVPLIALHGYGSEAVEAEAGRAKTLCDELGDARRGFAANRVVWNASLMRHPVPQTLAHARALMDLARAIDDPLRLALAHRALGTSLKLAGELREAADLLEQGIVLADRVADDEFVASGEHPGMICRAFAGWVQGLMGCLDVAARLADDAIQHARHRRHLHNLAFALVSSGLVYLFLRDAATARQVGGEVITLAREYRLPQWLGFGHEIEGWARFRQGERAEGLRLQEEGLRHLLATGARTHTGRMYVNLAESYLVMGQTEPARAHLSDAQAHRERHGEHYYAAEMCRVEARLLQQEGAAPEEVERGMQSALGIARGQGAGLLELRAAADLARLWSGCGERDAAREILARSLAPFSAARAWPDVAEALALGEELAS
jgi:DNA-binding winged helix-turn-helix (wHTH) protein/tetratricopeptide (TPR) repeat protein